MKHKNYLSSPMQPGWPPVGDGASHPGDKEGWEPMIALGAPSPAVDTIGLQITETLGDVGDGHTMPFPTGTAMRVGPAKE